MAEPGGEGAGTGAQDPEILEVRTITDIETLRVLADPLRLSILGAFASGPRRQPMSAKEIAEKIDEGQTKLYRHIKKLEDVGLLKVAETRVVSGIIEKRYVPGQKRLEIEGSMLAQEPEPEDFTDAMVAMMDSARDRLRTEIRAGRVPLTKPDEGPDRSLQIGSIRVNMTLDRYEKLRTAVTELLENLGPSDDSPDAFPVYLQALLYVSTDSPRATAPSDAGIAEQAEQFLAAEQAASEAAELRRSRTRNTGDGRAKRRQV
jgi:DNA-binding transcriptional ArsR family regulator